MRADHASVTIRHLPVAEASFEELAALINAAYRSRYGHIMKGDRTSAEEMAHEVSESGGQLLVALQGDALRGCAMVARGDRLGMEGYSRDWDGDRSDALYIGLAAVEPSAMRGGIGKQIVRAVEHMAGERRLKRVILTTLREFELPPYYEALGYRTVATEEFEAGHWTVTVPHQLHYMEKPL